MSYTEYKLLQAEMSIAIIASNTPFGQPNFVLRTSKSKLALNSIFKRLIDKHGVKHSWNEIDNKILNDYLFEFAKHCRTNLTCQTKRETTPQQPLLLTSQPPLTPNRTSYRSSPALNLSSPFPHPLSPTTPAALSISTLIFGQNEHQVHLLKTCLIRVIHDKDNKVYEDTINIFLKSASKNLVGEYGPNDYDFNTFKENITSKLSYSN